MLRLADTDTGFLLTNGFLGAFDPAIGMPGKTAFFAREAQP